MEQQQNNSAAPQDGYLRPKPDGTIDPAGEAGWFLERERLMRGLTLDMVADETGIHPYHLEAIEYGDMTHMPPRLEALEMIAAYAHHLGFDAEPLLHHYVTFLPAPRVAPRHHPANPAPMMSAKVLQFGRMPKLPKLNFKLPQHLPTVPGGSNGIVAAVAAAFLLFGGASYMFSGSDVPVEQVAEAPVPMPEVITDGAVADVKISETALTDSDLAANGKMPAVVEAPPKVAEAQDDSLGAFIAQQLGVEDSDPQTTAAVSKPTPDAPVAGARVFGSDDKTARVVLKAVRPIWLLIEDSQGNRVATQMLNAGDSYRVPDRAGLVAIAQDGGALTFMIDGVDKGVLGTPGALLAAEPLDVRKLEAKG